MSDRANVLVRGVGDVGSAVAALLFRAGYAVALHDEPAPTAPRRGMAFADAVFGRARFVYAPEAGRFITGARIGDWVENGAAVATIGLLTLRAPIGGVLRGLTRSGVQVAARTKVIEVDPRGDAAGVFGLGERPRRIAEGVVRAMSSLRVAEPA